jgi:hypothetical protein
VDLTLSDLGQPREAGRPAQEADRLPGPAGAPGLSG